MEGKKIIKEVCSFQSDYSTQFHNSQESNTFCDADPDRCDEDGRYLFFTITSYPDFLIRCMFFVLLFLNQIALQEICI